MRSMLIKLFLVALVAAIFTIPAVASAASTAPVAHAASSYCGPPAMNKTQWVSFWRDHPNSSLTKSFERLVRADAKHTHIKKDQTFLSWAQSPNIKIVRTPPGYRLDSNTYCPGGQYQPYPDLLGYGNQLTPSWCEGGAKPSTTVTKVQKRGKWYYKYTTTVTESCAPLAKGYCRNRATGKSFKVVKRKVTYKRIKHKTPKCGCKPKPKPPPAQVNYCPNGSPVVSGVACVNQSQAQEVKQDCKGPNVDSTQCISIQIQQQIVCGNGTIIIGSSTTTSTTGDQCNTVIVVPPPPPPVCIPPTTGTYPNCQVPTCPAGTTGTYPVCNAPAVCPAGDLQATDTTLSGFGYRTGDFLGIAGGYFQYYVRADGSGKLFFAKDYTSVQSSYTNGSPICGKANPAGPGGTPPPPSP